MSDDDLKDPQEQKQYSSSISPRLASKIAGRYDDEEDEKGPGGMIAVIGLVVVIVVCGGLFLLGQGKSKKDTGHSAEAGEAAAAAAADSAHMADSLAQLAMADSLARAQSTPTTPAASKPAPTPVPVQDATPDAAAAPAAPSTQYGIAVASYLFEDRANEEKDKLAAATSLAATVIPRDEGGTTMYQVVLGSFGSRKEATSKGTELLSAGTVTESRVVPLKR